MTMLDNKKLQAGLDVLTADLAKRNKTMQEVADEDKTAALEKMKATTNDPAYAKLFDEK